MSDDEPGTAVTFYSYKGGVGRSFALVSTAVTLASWGKRVLCVDWDLEAPGLSHYLRHWIGDERGGVLELVKSASSGSPLAWPDLALSVDLELKGHIDLLPAGRTHDYAARLAELDWADLYLSHDLGNLVEDFRREALDEYDFVLIDSRTGLTDIGGICAAQLPDILVMVLTPNEQSVRGTIDIARRAAEARDALPYDRAGLNVLPVLSRFDAREERMLALEWKERLARDLAHLYATWIPRGLEPLDVLDYTAIPYVTYWSFGEGIPALNDRERSSDPESIRFSLDAVAALLATNLADAKLLLQDRSSYVDGIRDPDTFQLRRPRRSTGNGVFISYPRRAAGIAEQLGDRLERILPRHVEVHTGLSDVPAGANISASLADAIEQSLLALILIDTEWLADVQEEGSWIRLEAEFALGAGLNVIPVLLPGAAMPSLTELPTSLSQLAHTQAFVLEAGRLEEGVADLAELVVDVRQPRTDGVPARTSRQQTGIWDRVLDFFRRLAG
jgi:MinD-like ATPase involved in chromosome partitioning or flagellar assembly